MSSAYPFTSSAYSNQSSSRQQQQPRQPQRQQPSPYGGPSNSSSPAASSSNMALNNSNGAGARRYYGQAPGATPSTTNLLGPNYVAPSTSRGQAGGVTAAMAQAPPQLRQQASQSSLNDSYSAAGLAGNGSHNSISDKFSLSPDPHSWGADISPHHPEPDDFLHIPDPRRDRKSDRGGTVFTSRGLSNVGCLLILCTGLVTLFAGYPLITYFSKHPLSTLGGFNLGGINASGQVPSMAGNWGLIDVDTPQSAYTTNSYTSGDEWQLVFSDEFNTDGRTFYPGDDPYWEAVDLHYWSTNNLEWYDPASITTSNGSLVITLEKKETHGLNFQGGMMSTWNKFCFTGGLFQASVQLPGVNNIVGLWPAVWAMGNLGRAGYGASLDGMWPYTYDACDVGTAPNQTLNGLPLSATTSGPSDYNNELSYLPGQRLSRCTCKGESHPGPVHSDGTYVGRSAPEIDMFEAQITGTPLTGQVSQSAQWAPFNDGYIWFNTSTNLIIPDTTLSAQNGYIGGVYQQATSVVTDTNQSCYEGEENPCYSTYGFEYQPGFDGAYISWIADDKLAWTLNSAGMAADTNVEISARPIPQEPMYLIVNLGMSENFGTVDLEHLPFPVKMSVDWIRVYQPKNSVNVGCDPQDFPTAAYINEYIEAYTNPNLTIWTGTADVGGFGQPIPKSSFLNQC